MILNLDAEWLFSGVWTAVENPFGLRNDPWPRLPLLTTSSPRPRPEWWWRAMGRAGGHTWRRTLKGSPKAQGISPQLFYFLQVFCFFKLFAETQRQHKALLFFCLFFGLENKTFTICSRHVRKEAKTCYFHVNQHFSPVAGNNFLNTASFRTNVEHLNHQYASKNTSNSRSWVIYSIVIRLHWSQFYILLYTKTFCHFTSTEISAAGGRIPLKGEHLFSRSDHQKPNQLF